MWQSFAAIGRGASEMWLPKEKKNICGKTEARPELIVPGGLNTSRVKHKPVRELTFRAA